MDKDNELWKMFARRSALRARKAEAKVKRVEARAAREKAKATKAEAKAAMKAAKAEARRNQTNAHGLRFNRVKKRTPVSTDYKWELGVFDVDGRKAKDGDRGKKGGGKGNGRGKQGKSLKEPKAGGKPNVKGSDVIVDVKQETETVKVGKETYRIPVDKDGFVPKEALAARFLDAASGDRQGRLRSPLLDQGVDSEIVIRGEKLKPEDVKHWWAYPNESDIKGIDTKDASIFQVADLRRKGSVNSQRKIAIVDATADQSHTIRTVLDNSFTQKELRDISKGDGVVVVVDPHAGDPGAYYPTANRIVLHPGYAKAPGTVTHEFVHHLKKKQKRKGPATSSQVKNLIFTNETINLEEAATTAETITRISPYHKVKNPSYYTLLPGVKDEKEAYRRIDSDRELFVGNNQHGRQGLKGKRAVDSVEAAFGDSHIGELRYKSHRSAKETAGKSRKKVEGRPADKRP